MQGKRKGNHDSVMEADNLVQRLGIKHIGIIMDGNGRWAEKRGLPRKAGHPKGAEAFRRCLNSCVKLGIPCVTFYAFSTENWSRPKDEVDALMNLFLSFMDEMMKLSSKNIRLRFIGAREGIPEKILEKMEEAESRTVGNTGMWCCVAFNYGGKEEILHAAKKAMQMYKDGKIDSLNEEEFSSFLYTSGLPDVDLIIRPSGEQRLSNFLIWQAAYAEFVFMDVLWPDFSEADLVAALTEYGKRNRRFGGV